MRPVPHRPISPSKQREAPSITADAGRYESLIAPTEEDVGEDAELSVDGNGEEAEPVKHAADPGAPTATQVEDHRKTHIPFRSWCKWLSLIHI